MVKFQAAPALSWLAFSLAALLLSCTVEIEYAHSQDRASYHICQRSSDGALVVRRRCHRKQTRIGVLDELRGPKGDTGNTGPVGPVGPQGESGVLGLYGDGSSGNVTLTNASQLDGPNLFHNITIPNGTTLVVPSGLTLRCTGTFTNNGTIEIEPFASGASHSNNEGDHLTHLNIRPASAGNSTGPAGNGASGVAGNPAVPGGLPSPSLDQITLRSLISPGTPGGGGGGAPGFSTQDVNAFPVIEGGAGGGTIRILCRGGLYNDGLISANGAAGTGPGVGGGAGGAVILASAQEVVNSGIIEAKAADGNNADQGNIFSAGGGGGGGLVHLLGPIVDNPGVTEVTGGNGGTGGGGIPPADASGGGAGGSFAGKGGSGGIADGQVRQGEDGQDGAVLTTIVFEPAYLFR